jgi:hypothetical protein
MMILTRAQPARRILPHSRRDKESYESAHDPAHLGAEIRELAVKAHRTVRACAGFSATRTADSDPREELSELHARISRLQRELNAQGLRDLASYVAALRQKVEEQLTTP